MKTATGLDRLELEVAYFLSALSEKSTIEAHFVAARGGKIVHFAEKLTRRFLDSLGETRLGHSGETEQLIGQFCCEWRTEDRERSGPVHLHRPMLRRSVARPWASMLFAREYRSHGEAKSRTIYLKVSHQGLERIERYQRLKKHACAKVVFYLHDLIPVNFPEYGREGESARHNLRLQTICRVADLVLLNSESTRDEFLEYCKRNQCEPPNSVTIGLPVAETICSKPPIESVKEPYFVCIGTLEPRKNHLLLFQLWRRLQAELGAAAPRLVLVGRSGWENENILDVLERAPFARDLIYWFDDMPDVLLTHIMAGARALLLPSIVEGYGMPLAEALTAGVPAICSDIPSLRSVGGSVPEYIDALDSIAWLNAIREYTFNNSVRRAAQLRRVKEFQPVRWRSFGEDLLTQLEALF